MDLVELRNRAENLIKGINPFEHLSQADITAMSRNINFQSNFDRLQFNILDNDSCVICLYNNDLECITGKYKTSVENEVIYVLVMELINDISWKKVCEIAPSEGAGYIEYGDDEAQFEQDFKSAIISQLPDWFQKYYTDDFCIDKKFEYFSDSAEYKNWLNS